MKIILSVDAIAPPLTGIGRYALELARGIARDESIESKRFFAAWDFVGDPEAALAANRGVARARRHVPFKTFALRSYLALRSAVFRRRARGLTDHVLHCPNFLLLDHDGPAVITVHDLSWVHFPAFHPVERVRVLDRLLPRSLARATRIVTDSDFVRREVIAHWGVPASRVVAVPLGVSNEFRPRSRDSCAPVLAKHGLTDVAYLLAVATAEPRKNLAALVEAYARLPATVRERHPLVVAGARGWHDDGAMPAHVHRLGYIAEDDLPALYSGAHAFAFPSIYEGFGLPPLEAMASGIPVLTSNVSSLPEVVGEAALLVDPRDADALAGALARLVQDDAWRVGAIERGLVRAAQFTWTRCVERTLDVYRSAQAA